MKKLKPMLYWLAAALALGCPAVALAGGASTCELGISTGTAAVQCASSTGGLYTIEIDSAAAAGAWVVCYDSGSTSGITALQDGTAAAPKIAGLTAVTTSTSYSLSSGISRAFKNGLVCIKNASSTIARALYATP